MLAVEKLLGLEIPPKAQWMRVMLNELTRINSHLVWLGTHALDIGAMTVFLYCFREREDILRLFEMVSGQRMMTSYFRIGGLALEPPLGFFERVQDFATRFPSKVDEYENLLTGNPIWGMRTKGVGRITAEDAVALGCSGPTLRGSGVDFDLRRDMPYSSYEKFKFKVPVSQDGDVFARYACRVAEMRESIAMVQQAVDGMPEGPIKAVAPKVILPDREMMKTQMEALIYHFKIITEGFAVPAGEVYQAVESPRGEMGYYVVSDGTAKPYRVHMRAACLANLQALPSSRIIQAAIADGVQHQAMLIAQAVFFLLVGEAAGQLVPVGSRPFADTAATHEYLGLQQQLAFAGLALHVVDGVALLDVGVKAKNHACFVLRRQKSDCAYQLKSSNKL